MIYLDTSALVKKYVSERGTAEVRELMKRERRIVTSKLTYPEICAALARKQREGGVDRLPYQKIWASFSADWQALVLVELSDALFPLVRRLTDEYPLRGADAVHLASALWLGMEIKAPLTFVAADHPLLKAASDEGLAAINPGMD